MNLSAALWIITVLRSISAQRKQPHIVFVLADDLGYNDVGYSRYTDVNTDNLNHLHFHALKLNHSYTEYSCTPSRAALLTGKYAFRYGLQGGRLLPSSPNGLDTDLKLLPQRLKDVGYQTHMVGKWHVGYCKDAFTPLRRGFDTFRGYYCGSVGYYNHARFRKGKAYTDYWHNHELVDNDAYSMFDFANYTVSLINGNTDPRPMFMYLSMQSVHSPLDPPPNVLPQEKNYKRAVYRRMVEVMDDFVGDVVGALRHNGMWRNTVFIFSSDNGGQTSEGGNNYPLRGAKHTLWEGGTRTRSFITGPNIPQGVYNGLFHIVDWLPTIMSIAGVEDIVEDLDGVNQWFALQQNTQLFEQHPRKSFIYHMDDIETYNGTFLNFSSVRMRDRNANGELKDYKLILGSPGKMNKRCRLYQPCSADDKHEINFVDGAVFDMTVDDVVAEEEPLEGHEITRELLKAILRMERAKGFVGSIEQRPNKLAWGMKHRSGVKVLAPGWC